MTNTDNTLISADERIRVHDRTFRPFISKEEIDQIVGKVAKAINHDYAAREVTILVVLKGSLIFAADLVRKLTMSCTIETLRASSYNMSMVSNGIVSLEDTFPDLADKHVIIVEDIVDTGATIVELIKHIGTCNPASVTVAALLSKPEMHREILTIDYVGLEISPQFVVGYGMDYAHYGRHLESIWVLDEEAMA